MKNNNLQRICDKFYGELDILQSLIKTMHDYCETKEMNSISCETRLELSKERNNYLNILKLAIERLQALENINNDFENNLAQ